jgi:hypothetical protein
VKASGAPENKEDGVSATQRFADDEPNGKLLEAEVEVDVADASSEDFIAAVPPMKVDDGGGGGCPAVDCLLPGKPCDTGWDCTCHG